MRLRESRQEPVRAYVPRMVNAVKITGEHFPPGDNSEGSERLRPHWQPGQKKSPASCFQETGRNTGDVLLSHNLEMHYHRGCSVSLPCSEWERVGPLRWDHQKSDEFEATLRLSGRF